MLPTVRIPLDLNRNVWIALICLNAGAPAFELWEYHTGSVNSTAALLSVAFVLIILNFIFLWTLFARARRRGWPLRKKNLNFAAVAMALFAFLSTALGISLVKQRNSYLDLATSDVPLSSIEPERERLVVELIRRTAANSREENKAMADAQKVPMIPTVYSVDSFANLATMQSTLAHLTTYATIDFQYFAKQQAARKDFRRKMAACDPDYLKSWNIARQEQEDLEKSADRLEHAWFDSVNALYTYGEQHTKDIQGKGGQISISSPTVREKFDELYGQSKALHEKLELIVQQEVKHQKEAKARVGE